MTPTDEMIAMAERIAGHGRDAWWSVAYKAALTAIMEVSEKAADLVVFEMVQEPDNVIDTTCNALVSDLYRAIRNGEHLR